MRFLFPVVTGIRGGYVHLLGAPLAQLWCFCRVGRYDLHPGYDVDGVYYVLCIL